MTSCTGCGSSIFERQCGYCGVDDAQRDYVFLDNKGAETIRRTKQAWYIVVEIQDTVCEIKITAKQGRKTVNYFGLQSKQDNTMTILRKKA